MNILAQSNDDIIKQWGVERATLINQKQRLLKIKHGKNSSWKNVKSKVKKRAGKIYKVGVSVPKHAMYVRYGVGKGRPAKSAKVTPKDWTTPFYDGVEDLADKLMLNCADKLQSVTLKIR